jgi:hypothetical protein
MGFDAPSAYEARGSDLHRDCLTRLRCASRLSQPPDAFFLPGPSRLCFAPLTLLGFTLQRFSLPIRRGCLSAPLPLLTFLVDGRRHIRLPSHLTHVFAQRGDPLPGTGLGGQAHGPPARPLNRSGEHPSPSGQPCRRAVLTGLLGRWPRGEAPRSFSGRCSPRNPGPEGLRGGPRGEGSRSETQKEVPRNRQEDDASTSGKEVPCEVLPWVGSEEPAWGETSVGCGPWWPLRGGAAWSASRGGDPDRFLRGERGWGNSR